MEFYGLRLTEAVLTYDPVEVVLLVAGLPARSRYAARLEGEPHGTGWAVQDWLNLDTRNTLEGLRATVVNMAAGKDKRPFREWTHYPGHQRQEKVDTRRALDRLAQVATPVTE